MVPALLEEILRTYRAELKNNPKIADLRKKLASGKVTYAEADEFAVELGQALEVAFERCVSSDVLPEGRMFYNIASRLIPAMLQEAAGEAADFAQQTQQALNQKARIGLKAKRAPYDTNREKGLIEYAVQAEK